MTHPSYVLAELGDQVRSLARRRQVAQQVGADGQWVPIAPELIALAGRCSEWALQGPGA